jgi:hypothetical protein
MEQQKVLPSETSDKVFEDADDEGDEAVSEIDDPDRLLRFIATRR